VADQSRKPRQSGKGGNQRSTGGHQGSSAPRPTSTSTGTRKQIDALLKDYGISASKRLVEGSKTDYTMHHSSYLYFIDRNGMQRALMPFGRPADDIVHDLQLLLKP